MTYVVGLVLIGLGCSRLCSATDSPQRTHGGIAPPWPDTSDPRVQRVSGFGFALFGVLLVAVDAYVVTLAARVPT